MPIIFYRDCYKILICFCKPAPALTPALHFHLSNQRFVRSLHFRFGRNGGIIMFRALSVLFFASPHRHSHRLCISTCQIKDLFAPFTSVSVATVVLLCFVPCRSCFSQARTGTQHRLCISIHSKELRRQHFLFWLFYLLTTLLELIQ